ncbi:MAG: CinA family protein [Halanaeroarchaeum sp.]
MTDRLAVAERIGDLLADADQTLATAESCTGGAVGSLVTDVSGASEYFDRAYVTYSYDAKLDLGVPRELLDEEGAVSEPVAAAMARGARDRAGTTWAVATTGIAGPTGGTPEKPVGTVFVGVAYAGPWGSGESYATVERATFEGDRRTIKEAIAEHALEVLADEVLAVGQ